MAKPPSIISGTRKAMVLEPLRRTKYFPPGGYLPAFAFGKLGIAVCEELLADVLGHMVAGGAIFDKMQQFSCRCMLHGDVLHSLFLFGGIIAHVMLLGKRTLPLCRTKQGQHLCICPYLVEL